MSIDCSPSRPPTNCKTSCHSLLSMWSATNLLNFSPFMVSVMCLAARNSCMVRWMKQYWASSVKGSGLRSGSRWKRPLLTKSSGTSFCPKISLFCVSPSKASLASGLIFFSTLGGKCFELMSSRRRSLSRYCSSCRQKKNFMDLW